MEFEVVIPSIKEHVKTLDSIPQNITTHVIRDGTLNEARNAGVERADSDVVIIMDDDIAFEESKLYDIANRVTPTTLIGVAEEIVGLVLGRMMAFHKDLWESVGGFDERLRSHNGDTDFAIKAVKKGFHLERVPQYWFDHEEHPRSITPFDWAWRLAYLCLKHPRWSPHLIDSIILKPHMPKIRFWTD